MGNLHYTYRKNEKIQEVTALSGLLFFILYFIVLDASKGTMIFFSVLLTGLLFLLLNYGYLWNTSLALEDQDFTIQRRIGKNSSFPWSTIRRIVLREGASLSGRTTAEMVIFVPGKTQKIILSDLKDTDAFVEALDLIARHYAFNVVCQDKNGKTISIEYFKSSKYT